MHSIQFRLYVCIFLCVLTSFGILHPVKEIYIQSILGRTCTIILFHRDILNPAISRTE